MYLIKQRIRTHLFVNFSLYKYLLIIIIIIYEAYKKQYMSNHFDITTLDTGNELISKMAAENKRRTSGDEKRLSHQLI